MRQVLKIRRNTALCYIYAYHLFLMLNNYSCVYTTGSSCVIKIVIPKSSAGDQKGTQMASWRLYSLRKSFFSVGSFKGKGSFEATGESYAKGVVNTEVRTPDTYC